MKQKHGAYIDKPKETLPRIALLILTLATLCPFSLRAATFTLGTTEIVEESSAGTDTVFFAVSPETTSWTATANHAWLHLTPTNSNGIGSTNVFFTFDANPGLTRTGTLTMASQTLTVIQAGSTYVPAPAPVITAIPTGLYYPKACVVDDAGNLYVADSGHNQIKIWTATNNTLTTLQTPGLNTPGGLTVDSMGNVYIADTFTRSIKKWTRANNTLSTLVTGLGNPYGVAVDKSDYVYIADTDNNAIRLFNETNNSLTTLISSGLNGPSGLALDQAGNLYIADRYNNSIKKWNAANGTINVIVSTGLISPDGVALDGAGNVYIADTGQRAIKKWTAANNTVTTLVSSGLLTPRDVAVDRAGTVYFTDTGHDVIKALPRAFVDPSPIFEGMAAGTDALPLVLPTSVNLLAPFSPITDQPWLSINGITNGQISFSFTTNDSTNRTGHITVFGQSIPITQAGPVPILINPITLADGSFQFAFSNYIPGASFTILTSTNLALPLTNWTVLGSPTNTALGLFQFTTPPSANNSHRFYRISSP